MKLLKVLAIGVTVGGIALAINHEKALADTWTPRTVEQIKADIKGNEYTIVWGDTLSGISQATNITVQKLADINKIANIDLIYAGNKLVFEGNVATVQDDKGETVAQTVIQDSDKIDATKPIGQATQQTTTPSTNDTVSGNTQTSGQTQTTGNTETNAGGNGGNVIPTPAPTPTPTPTPTPDPQPVSQAQAVTINYVDENGTAIASATTLTGSIGQTVTANAKTINGYTLTSSATLSFTISDKAQSGTFTYKKNVEKPYPINPYHGTGTCYATEKEANEAGYKAMADGKCTRFGVVPEDWSDGTSKYYLELYND